MPDRYPAALLKRVVKKRGFLAKKGVEQGRTREYNSYAAGNSPDGKNGRIATKEKKVKKIKIFFK